ncbi:hypothetical protein AU468_05345 [Alkalispirochaeta sphaeroplastigenens]|uniref:VCBS repeat-containing protein n=1 Tax=Alkalispirochaeta sphaeroplastigenens TaxID=1187066 RepID=A0A2S4JUW7_9SPIO|nr:MULTISPECIES: hypothetical protein [Alkalispirochaeta]POR03283.1 hypothetical protein AU468_05345 [Alkalispirochaeta sphaeroplastigenens]
MKYRTSGVASFLVVSLVFIVLGQALAGDESFPLWPVEDYGSGWILGDRNSDGTTDYALRLDDRGEKKYEAVDHNHDGIMDNFYFYSRGVLERQEIDTNFDGNIDLWIFMDDGVHVRGFDRDTNHDGQVDLVRRYGEN